MRFLSEEELSSVKLLISDCYKRKNDDFKEVEENIKKILMIYYPDIDLDYYVDDVMLKTFARNFKHCRVKSDGINFNISYKTGKKKYFIRANCLTDIVCGKEVLSVVDDSCSFLARKGDPVVLCTNIIGGGERKEPLCKKFKIGPLAYLDNITVKRVKNSCMGVEGIECVTCPSDWSLGTGMLYSYDYSSSLVKKNNKEMVKK